MKVGWPGIRYRDFLMSILAFLDVDFLKPSPGQKIKRGGKLMDRTRKEGRVN